MPALLPVPGVVETQWFMAYAGRTCSVRAFWSDFSTTEYSTSDVHNLCTAARSSFGANFIPLLTDHLEFTEVTTTDLFSDTAPRETQVSAGFGTVAAEGEASNVALVIKFNIARRYRGGKPHVFFPGIPVGNRTTEDQWSAGEIAAFDAAWAAVVAAMGAVAVHGASFVTQVNVSRFHAHAERGSPIFEAVDSFAVQPRVCSRRKRLPKITS